MSKDNIDKLDEQVLKLFNEAIDTYKNSQNEKTLSNLRNENVIKEFFLLITS